jgi:5-methylcytosine-specific restriction protein A
MPAYFATWNPKRWRWTDFKAHYDEVRRTGFIDETWSCGVTRRIKENDRLFLLKLGTSPKGIIGSGYATSEPYEDTHYSDPDRTAWYIDARFDVLLDHETEILERSRLRGTALDKVNFSPQASGTSISAEATEELEAMWSEHLTTLGLSVHEGGEEVKAEERFWEGALRRITVNAYERDARARAACIAHYGTNCSICDFSFGAFYGERAKDFIHVHHLRQLSEIREGYSVDPIKDLIPVCPNCHAVIHRNPPITMDEMKQIIRLIGSP